MSNLKVGDVMTAGVFAVRPDDDMATLYELMQERHIRHVPVVDDEQILVGIVSHRDLLRSSLVEQVNVPEFVAQTVLERVKVREVMTGSPDAVTPDTALGEAAQMMLDNRYGCLPVVEGGGRLVGILTEADFVRLAVAAG